MMNGRHIAPEDLALFATQALPPDESASVRLHLEYCDHCRDELARVRGDLALVALSVEQTPVPAGARERFLERLAAVPTPARRAEHVEVMRMGLVKRIAPSVAIWVPWLAAAALLLVAVSLEMKIGALDRQLKRAGEQLARMNATAAHAQQVLEVLTAPGAQRVVLTTGKPLLAPTGRAAYLPSRGALVFQASNLAQIDENKTYELWVIPASGSAPIPAGLFRPDMNGAASVVLPPLPVGVPAKAFGVTLERAEGAAKPTAPILLIGAVPSLGF